MAIFHHLSYPAKIGEQNPHYDEDEHDYGGKRYGTAGSSKTCSSGHDITIYTDRVLRVMAMLRQQQAINSQVSVPR